MSETTQTNPALAVQLTRPRHQKEVATVGFVSAYDERDRLRTTVAPRGAFAAGTAARRVHSLEALLEQLAFGEFPYIGGQRVLNTQRHHIHE